MMIFEHTVPAGVIALALVLSIGIGLLAAWRLLPRNRIGFSIMGFYTLVLLGMGWCLLLPGKRDAVTNVVKPRFLIAIDTSRSMTLSPSEEVASRWEVAREILNMSWRQALSAEAEVEIYPFSSTLGEPLSPGALDTLEPDGDATHLRDSLNAIGDRTSGLNVVGMLLLSDGLDTREVLDDWADVERPFPIHSLALEPPGDWQLEPDLRIDAVVTSRRVTVGWQTECRVHVSGQGTRGGPVAVQIFKNDELIAEQPVQIPDEGGERELLFELDHPEQGLFTYRVHVPPLEGETNTADNEFVFNIQVTDARNRLLYVEGSPRWEYRYLRRVLLGQEQITPVIFFSGADGQPRPGTPAGDMTAGMTPEELAIFQIVVIGNLDAAELGEERVENLIRFVEDGGSLVLLGGAKAWGDGGVFQTGLQKVLPVRGTGTETEAGETPFPVRLTDAARGHPAFAGDAELWEVIPPVLSVFSGVELTAGAQELVSVETPSGSQPLVVTQRYGQGKVTTFLTDTLWRWQLGPEAGTNQPYQRFWTQMIGWLLPTEEEMQDNRIEILGDRDQLFLGGSLDLHARVGESAGVVQSMQAIITYPNERELPFDMSAQQVITATGRSFPGYALSFSAELPGLYKVVARGQIDGVETTSDPFTFFVRPYSPETIPRPAQFDLLRSISESSKGMFFEDSEELNSALSSITIPVIEEESATYETLWRNWFVIAALMILLTCSWGMRKHSNMP